MKFETLDPGHTPVAAEVRALFPGDVALALCDPRRPLGGLLGHEGRALGRMADRRQREFTAGRYAARRAMADLGVPPQPVLSGEDRAPIWPPGLVGSLSHDASLCICALGRASDVLSLGVDVEKDEDLDPDRIEILCTPKECAWLYRQADADRGRLAKLLFCAKETAYKAQYPLNRQILTYHDIEVEPDLRGNRFWAAFTRDAAPFAVGDKLDGKFCRADGTIVTAICLRPETHDKTTNRSERARQV